MSQRSKKSPSPGRRFRSLLAFLSTLALVAVAVASPPAREQLPIGHRSVGGDASAPAAAAPSGSGARSSWVPGWLDGGSEWFKTLAPLATVLVLAVAVKALVNRRGLTSPRPAGVVEIVARYPVGRRQQLVVMRVGRRVVVAQEADRAMKPITEITDPEEVGEILAAVQEAKRSSFPRLLARHAQGPDPFEDAEVVDLTVRSRGRNAA